MAPKKKQIKHEFAVGDLVGAKVKGHSMWPGKVEKVEIVKPNRKRYTVRFFHTNDTGSNFLELKPFVQLKDSEFNLKNESLLKAIALCRREVDGLENGDCTEIEKVTHTEGKYNDGKVALSVDEENNLTIDETNSNNDEKKTKRLDRSAKRIKLDKKGATQVHFNEKEEDKTPRQRNSRSGKVSVIDIKQEADSKNNAGPTKTSKDLDSGSKPEKPATKPNIRASSRKRLPDATNNTLTETKVRRKTSQQVKSDQRISGPITNSSPNIDLKSESDASEGVCHDANEKLPIDSARSNHSLSKSAIDHNSRLSIDEEDENYMQNSTIEKLKKKLAVKMQEKETLKLTRLQRKAYERASKKFPTVYKKLDHVLSLSEKLLKKELGNKSTTSKLEDAHRNLEATLLKCIDKLTTDYGRTQKDRIKFHETLSKIATNLKFIRDTLSTQNPDLAKIVKRLLKVYKTKAIRDFINDASIDGNLDDAMNERKENDAIKMG